MIKNPILVTLFFITFFSLKAQETKKGIFNVKKAGILYNYVNEDNFIFDHKDFTYHSNTLKIQAFYNLGKWKGFDIELIVQPQIQVSKHQLLNPYFVAPRFEDEREKKEEFTQLKTMHLYAFELGFAFSRSIFEKLDLQITAGLGVATIDTRTERLAKGFTFLENASFGVNYTIFRKTYLYLGTNVGHISNLDFKSPNNGYTFLGIEVGVSYRI